MYKDVSKFITTIDSVGGTATLSTERISHTTLRARNKHEADSFFLVPAKPLEPSLVNLLTKLAMAAIYNDGEEHCDVLELMDVVANSTEVRLKVFELDYKNDSVNITFSNPSIVFRAPKMYNRFIQMVNSEGLTQYNIAEIMSHTSYAERLM